MSTDPQLPLPILSPQKRRVSRPGLWFLVAGSTLVLLAVGTILTIRSRMASYYLPSESMVPTLKKGDRFLADKTAYANGKLPTRGDIVVFEAPPSAAGGRTDVIFTKRVIALPGDTVAVHPATLVVGGTPVDPSIEAANLHEYLQNKLGLNETDSIKIAASGLVVNQTVTLSTKQIAEKLNQSGAKVVLTPGHVLLNGKPLEMPYLYEDPDYAYPPGGGTLTVPEGKVFVLGDNINHSADSHAWGPLPLKKIIGRVLLPQ